MEELELTNQILKNERFVKTVAHIEELESDRVFCHHDMDHFLDVARIATLMANDSGEDIGRDIIYSAALLHDIGRAEQYKTGIKHETAGEPIAKAILSECGASEEIMAAITDAVREHGNEAVKNEKGLRGLIYRADKASRKCYRCGAAKNCHKSQEKRVMEIRY